MIFAPLPSLEQIEMLGVCRTQIDRGTNHHLNSSQNCLGNMDSICGYNWLFNNLFHN